MADEPIETQPAALEGVDGSASVLARRPEEGGLLGAIHRLNRWMHYAAAGVLVVLTMITVANILGRALFNRPVPGTIELTEMLMVLIVYMGFGYAEHQGDHISVDLLYERSGRTARLGLTVLNGLVGFFVMGLVAWQLYQYAGVLSGGGYESSILKVPQAPLALIAVGATVVFVLAMLATAIVGYRALREERS
jgi:TRAP-type C4-dicarboxylate transport system permease small subunit